MSVKENDQLMINKYIEYSNPPMEKDEFNTVFSKFLKCRKASLKSQLYDKIFRSNIKLAIKLSYGYYRVFNEQLSFGDIVNSSMIGLATAINKFDHTLGTKFSTYAHHWIKKEIHNSISMQDIIFIPEKALYLKQQYDKLKNKLRDDTFFKDTFLINEKTLNAIKNLNDVKTLSIDLKIDDDGDTGSLIDIIADTKSINANERIIRSDKMSSLRKAIKELKPKEACAIKELFFNNRTLRETGEIMGLSAEGVRIIKIKAIKKIRSMINKENKG